ncbi:MAG: four-helix bundle copper-binding protein [Hyphomicrobium sp.]|jgi:Cys-rich four helix bundle protein (predicted Tat secretion target)
MTKSVVVAGNQPTSRRSVLAGALVASAGLTAVLSRAFAGDPTHDHMDGGGASPNGALIIAATDCVRNAEICAAHCVAALATGDTSLKDCHRAVLAMQPMCSALARFAAIDAPRLKELAKLCIDVCDDCEKQCKKHAEHHAVCKACGEACAACIKECRTLIGA